VFWRIFNSRNEDGFRPAIFVPEKNACALAFEGNHRMDSRTIVAHHAPPWTSGVRI
jgi:hypothetical protein